MNALRALSLSIVLSLPVMGLAAPSSPTLDPAGGGVPRVPRVDEARAAVRVLWEDHIGYTRNYLISALAELPDTSAVASRLLANQDQIGDAIKPYYGEAAGEALALLLRDHILIAAEVIVAAKAGDTAGLAAAQAEWSQNAKDIAAFLAKANRFLSQEELERMLQAHLDYTTAEVVARLGQDWDADIQAYDRGHAHMLMFSDTLTNAIARQFPSRFGKE